MYPRQALLDALTCPCAWPVDQARASTAPSRSSTALDCATGSVTASSSARATSGTRGGICSPRRSISTYGTCQTEPRRRPWAGHICLRTLGHPAEGSAWRAQAEKKTVGRSGPSQETFWPARAADAHPDFLTLPLPPLPFLLLPPDFETVCYDDERASRRDGQPARAAGGRRPSGGPVRVHHARHARYARYGT